MGAEAVHRVAANAFQCRLHHGIETAESAGREALDNTEGRNDAKACGRVWMRDAFCEQFGGEKAGLPKVGADAGEGGRDRLADKGVVVGTDKGHFLGDREAEGNGGGEREFTDGVVDAENAAGMGELREPGLEVALEGGGVVFV